jgi:hypothetical protein
MLLPTLTLDARTEQGDAQPTAPLPSLGETLSAPAYALLLRVTTSIELAEEPSAPSASKRQRALREDGRSLDELLGA